MQTKIDMKEPIKTISASTVSDDTLKRLPGLRGGDSCREHCYTIICIVVFLGIGLIVFVAGSAAYANNNDNTNARNALIAGGIILFFAIVCCVGTICNACADGSDQCCGCHLICCDYFK